jgi:hypothetical protein
MAADTAPIDKDVMLIVTDSHGEPYAVRKPFKLTATGGVSSGKGTPLAVTPLQWKPYVAPKKRCVSPLACPGTAPRCVGTGPGRDSPRIRTGLYRAAEPARPIATARALSLTVKLSPIACDCPALDPATLEAWTEASLGSRALAKNPDLNAEALAADVLAVKAVFGQVLGRIHELAAPGRISVMDGAG